VVETLPEPQEVETMEQEQHEVLEAAKQWLDVDNVPLIKWDTAKIVEGVYQGATEITGKFGAARRHEILVNGQPQRFFGLAVLERLLRDPRIGVGSPIRIEYLGTTRKTRGGRSAKDFRVKIPPR
jgi:hypothetical protein